MISDGERLKEAAIVFIPVQEVGQLGRERQWLRIVYGRKWVECVAD